MHHYNNVRYIRPNEASAEDDSVYSQPVDAREQRHYEEFRVPVPAVVTSQDMGSNSNSRRYKCWIAVLGVTNVILLAAGVGTLIYFVSIY